MNKINFDKCNSIAMKVAKSEPGFDQVLLNEQILEFLYSKVKLVRIIVTLPDTDNTNKEEERIASKNKYPQQNKKKQIKQLEEQLEKEQKEIDSITDEWKALKETIKSLPPDNNGTSFYKDLAVKVLKNRSFSIDLKRKNQDDNKIRSNNPYDENNKNSPYLYVGIDSLNDYRVFLISKFDENKMNFHKCIINNYSGEMPLDVYKTSAKLKINLKEVEVYVKFSIENNGNDAHIDLEFANYSFHPTLKQTKIEQNSNKEHNENLP
jgi:hypothetical protein